MKNALNILFVLMLVSPNHAFAKDDQKVSLAVEIQQMIFDLSCTDSSQCKSIGFGSRSCGGYEQYFLYSNKNVDEKLLEQKAQEYFKLDSEDNKKSGIGSICSIEEPKIAQCLNGRCQETVQVGDSVAQ